MRYTVQLSSSTKLAASKEAVGRVNEGGGTVGQDDEARVFFLEKKLSNLTKKALHHCSNSQLSTQTEPAFESFGHSLSSRQQPSSCRTTTNMPTAIEPAAPQVANKFVTELNPKGIKPYVYVRQQ